MSLSKIDELEEILEEEGYTELLMACKSILGSDGSETGVCISVNEDAMKETMNISKVYWLKHKIVILENIEIFEEKCQELGLKIDTFIDTINKDVKKVESIL